MKSIVLKPRSKDITLKNISEHSKYLLHYNLFFPLKEALIPENQKNFKKSKNHLFRQKCIGFIK